MFIISESVFLIERTKIRYFLWKRQRIVSFVKSLLSMEQKKRTEIATLGLFGLIDLLTGPFTPHNASTRRGVGDDAAVITPPAGEEMLCTTDSFYEGVDFDLTYFPLRHLGYKIVTAGVSDILAMNATPSQITVSLGVSSKIPVEALKDLYEGIAFACKELGIDLVGGDTRASMTGLVITVTTLGHAPHERIVYRSGAQLHDLICLTGNLGAAYMGLQLLEREKRVLADVKNPEPQFKGYEYLLEKYLKPRPRTDIVEALLEEKITPTSMIDLTDGLASDLMQLCKASKCGARIYLDRIPIARQTTALAEEMHTDPVIAALNGGEDYELLFTVPLAMQEQVMRLGLVDVIGHITAEATGAYLVTPDGGEIRLKAQGFPEK
jgi:thiamine-monophosphate kinase